MPEHYEQTDPRYPRETPVDAAIGFLKGILKGAKAVGRFVKAIEKKTRRRGPGSSIYKPSVKGAFGGAFGGLPQFGGMKNFKRPPE